MTKVESMASMNDGRWPPVARRFEHTSTVSPGSGTASRSTRRGCSPVMCTTAPRIMAALRVVEFGHETDASAGDPDADADDREAGVLDVPPVAAVGRHLALEEEVRAEHRTVRVARAAAEVLGPAVAAVTAAVEPVAGITVGIVAADAARGEELRIRPRHPRRYAGAQRERRHIVAVPAAAVADAAPVRLHPAAGTRAVEEAEVVLLHAQPGCARRAAAPAGGRLRRRSGRGRRLRLDPEGGPEGHGGEIVRQGHTGRRAGGTGHLDRHRRTVREGLRRVEDEDRVALRPAEPSALLRVEAGDAQRRLCRAAVHLLAEPDADRLVSIDALPALRRPAAHLSATVARWNPMGLPGASGASGT